MTAWQIIAAERRMLYSPIGLRLVDDFTGQPPSGRVRAFLDRQTPGGWETTVIKAERTPGDALIYPGLGRGASAAMQPPMHCRVRVEAEFYLADYLLTGDAIEFDAHPYDDTAPPAVIATLPQNLFLLPGPAYRFPGHVRVLRGQVTDAAAAPVANAEVTYGAAERTASDRRGCFALPLRWPAFTAAVQIDAIDHRTGRTGQITVNLPADLAGGHIVVIT